MTSNSDIGLAPNQPLPKGFSPKGAAAEAKALEMTIREMNNPALTGAVVPPEEVANIQQILKTANVLEPAPSALQDSRGATLPPSDPALQMPAPTPDSAPTPRQISGPRTKILLTGRTGAGKSFVAAQTRAHVLEFDTPIRSFIRGVLGANADGPAADPLVDALLAWGDGVVSAAYPLTPTRLLFVQKAKEEHPTFGQPGFWRQSFLDRVAQTLAQTAEQVIITGVKTSEDFHALVAAGFVHYHVVCSSNTYVNRPKRKNINDGLAAALDQDVTKKISQNRQGDKLRCIWSDVVAPPSSRVLTVAEWLQEIAILAAATQIASE